MAILTVFTPAFNRAHTIKRTFESLCRQSCKEFIWLIVDDGSSDNTRELIEQWQEQDNGFEIRYFYKENGGMHTAHNKAYENIDTELNICIDSDDCLADEAVEKILSFWRKYGNSQYAGIIGLDSDLSGNLIGSKFPDNLKETTLSGYYAAGGKGDKKLVYRTELMKKYPPYPVFEGEQYVGLNYKYLLCDQEYKLLVLNEVLCNVEYQDNGSSATMWRQYLKNPKGFAFIRTIYMQYPQSAKRLFIDCIHYVSSSILAKNKDFIAESPRKILTVLVVPFGIVLSVIVRYIKR